MNVDAFFKCDGNVEVQFINMDEIIINKMWKIIKTKFLETLFKLMNRNFYLIQLRYLLLIWLNYTRYLSTLYFVSKITLNF